MSLAKDDVKQIGEMIVEVTSPMFEHVIETLGGRMDKLEERMTRVERELANFKSEVRSRLDVLEKKIDALEAGPTDRFKNVEDDIQLPYRLVDKLENGTKTEMKFAEDTIIEHLPAIYKAVTLVAKKQNITLPKV